jgi:hypothetical protein
MARAACRPVSTESSPRNGLKRSRNDAADEASLAKRVGFGREIEDTGWCVLQLPPHGGTFDTEDGAWCTAAVGTHSGSGGTGGTGGGAGGAAGAEAASSSSAPSCR